MDHRDLRELVRLRHELRHTFLGGDAERARALLEQLRTMAARDPVESAAMAPEVTRWAHRLSVD